MLVVPNNVARYMEYIGVWKEQREDMKQMSGKLFNCDGQRKYLFY
jgi:hypothetical protein